MRLYLKGKSKNLIGYTPDWLKVEYKENGQNLELTLDIRGEIDYKTETLDCRVKGELIPWVLWNYETGEEFDLFEMSEEECYKLFPLEKIVEIICNSSSYTIGTYPAKEDGKVFMMAETDVLTECEGLLEIYDGIKMHEKSFKFETELNV